MKLIDKMMIDKMKYTQGYWDSNTISNATATAIDAVDAKSYTITMDVPTSTIVENLETTVNKIKKEVETLKKENNKNMFNFDFGNINTDDIRLSMYGIAVKNANGNYVSYDVNTHSVMNVDILNIPSKNILYKMPVAIKDIKAGDVVIHNRTPMFVVEPHESTIKVVDIREGTEKEIYLTKSPFGFNFAIKVVSLMDTMNIKADENNPFGGMLPFMMKGDIDPMFFFLMGKEKIDMNNPMMMYFMMKNSK